jgi:hypothetical protein
VNLNAGPAAISPNIYKACITHFHHSINNLKKFQTLNIHSFIHSSIIHNAFSKYPKLEEISNIGKWKKKNTKQTDPRSDCERQWCLNFRFSLLVAFDFQFLVFFLQCRVPHAKNVDVNVKMDVQCNYIEEHACDLRYI